jgi:predicted nuclease of predicted toxin-antitoxin system
VKFLVDHQLPPALAHFIQTQGHTAQHVREIGLMSADDRVIWRHSVTNDLILVSKDEDFYFLATQPGSTGKSLWVRIGNCRTKALLENFTLQLPRAVAAFEAGALVVELQ